MTYDPFLPLVTRIGLWFLAAHLIVITHMVLYTALIALLGWGKGALPPLDYWTTQFWLVFLAGCARPEAER